MKIGRYELFRTPAAVLLAAFLASCVGQTVVQISDTGTFNLRRYNGEELPYFEIFEGEDNCQASLEGGSLWLFQDSTFELNFDTFAQNPACNAVARAKWPQKTTGTYVRPKGSFSLDLVTTDGAQWSGQLNGASGATLVGAIGTFEFGR